LQGLTAPPPGSPTFSLIDEILAIVDLRPPFATQQRGSPRTGSSEFTGRIKVSLGFAPFTYDRAVDLPLPAGNTNVPLRLSYVWPPISIAIVEQQPVHSVMSCNE
jgi:hypothetical protein